MAPRTGWNSPPATRRVTTHFYVDLSLGQYTQSAGGGTFFAEVVGIKNAVGFAGTAIKLAYWGCQFREIQAVAHHNQ